MTKKLEDILNLPNVKEAFKEVDKKEKVLEEINELIEAVERDTNKIHEAADVLYHLIMYLEKSGIKIEEVMKELNNRRK